MTFDDLYQEIILDHYKTPRNKKDLSHISDDHLHQNPTCGDALKLEIRVRNGQIESLAFDGHGCAICTASASMMTEILQGEDLEEAQAMSRKIIDILRGELQGDLEAYGELEALSGVIRFPARVKCATLAWHSLLEETQV